MSSLIGARSWQLVGLSVLGATADWEDKASFGRWLGLVPLALLFAALVGRLTVRLIATAAALLVLDGLHDLLADADDDYLAALHLVSALALLWRSIQLGVQTRGLPNLPA